MRIHAGDSESRTLLLAYFDQQADCIAIAVAETEIEVSLLGSYGSVAHDAAVERLVARFRVPRTGPPAENGNPRG